MAKIMKAKDFVDMAKDIATDYKTLYVYGCFGSPMVSSNKKRYTNNHSYNKKTERTKKINNASADTFGFDCVCLIKGILWGWCGKKNYSYGGAKYNSNGVADISANQMMTSTYCTNISTDFSKIEVGEIVWKKGHVGIYMGNGLAIECSPIWKDGVQITAIKNIGTKKGYNSRTWEKHGKLIYIDYSKEEVKKEEPKKEEVKPTSTQKFNIGDKVIINGELYGNSNATKSSGTIKNKVTFITRYNKGSKHPYNTTGDLGWMDEKSISKYTEEKWTPKVGDIVVPIKLVDYRNKKLIQYDKKYEILKITDKGALLGAVRGTQRPIWATLKLDNLKRG